MADPVEIVSTQPQVVAQVAVQVLADGNLNVVSTLPGKDASVALLAGAITAICQQAQQQQAPSLIVAKGSLPRKGVQ